MPNPDEVLNCWQFISEVPSTGLLAEFESPPRAKKRSRPWRPWPGRDADWTSRGCNIFKKLCRQTYLPISWLVNTGLYQKAHHQYDYKPENHSIDLY